jgi:biotin carboxylase
MTSVPVLVMDGDERQALAACRALGRVGYEVGVAGSRERSLAGHSRYATRHHVLPDPRSRNTVYEERLVDIVQRHGYRVLLPSLDETFARVERVPLPAQLAPAPGQARDRLVDKLGLAEVATAADIPYPHTAVVRSKDDTLSLALPVVVKARRSAVAQPGRVAHNSGAVVAHTWEAAHAAAAALQTQGLEAIVQERIDRLEKINVTIVRRRLHSEVRFPYRVLRDLPLTGGIAVTTATLSVLASPGREALEALEALCDSVGYEGVANGEFVRSRRDGKLYLIEVNPRLWGSLWFAERLGQRVVEREVRAALDLEPLPDAPPPRRTLYHFPTSEVRWVRAHPRRGKPLLELLRSLRPGHVYEYVDRRDLGVMARHAVEKRRRARATSRGEARRAR